MKKFLFGQYPSPLDKIYLQEICQIAQTASERQWLLATSGNFSIRSAKNSCFYLSPSGIDKRYLSWDQFVPVDAEGNPLNTNFQKISQEALIHLTIMDIFPKAQVVLHAHTPLLVGATLKAKENHLSFVDQEFLKVFGFPSPEVTLRIPLAPNPSPASLPSFVKDKTAFAQYCEPSAQSIVFKNHGAYCWGTTPQDAWQKLEALEYLCQTTLT